MIRLALDSKDLFIEWILSILSHVAFLFCFILFCIFQKKKKKALDSQTLRLVTGRPLNHRAMFVIYLYSPRKSCLLPSSNFLLSLGS